MSRRCVTRSVRAPSRADAAAAGASLAHPLAAGGRGVRGPPKEGGARLSATLRAELANLGLVEAVGVPLTMALFGGVSVLGGVLSLGWLRGISVGRESGQSAG